MATLQSTKVRTNLPNTNQSTSARELRELICRSPLTVSINSGGGDFFTHLSNVGLSETIANDLNEYVELAVRLSAELSRLSEIRGRLRSQMTESPLCNGERFAGNFMELLRGAWRDWCAG